MSYFRWGPKPSVAQQRKNAEKKVAEIRKRGGDLSPVTIDGSKIASSFWGKSWCSNLEHYSDYANRLPRGRSYVRHGSVIDLQIAKGEITAQVNGSSLYRIAISIAPLGAKSWTNVCGDCSSSIDSMVELLQGRLSKAVMERVCRTGDGLFPSPKEIKLSCSCPDGAYMCKHVAAALYGVGARLDSRPELLFVLRGVEAQDLIAKVGNATEAATSRKAPKPSKVLADDDLAAVFGLDMAEPMSAPVATKPVAPTRSKPKATVAKGKAPLKSRKSTARAAAKTAVRPVKKGKRKKKRAVVQRSKAQAAASAI